MNMAMIGTGYVGLVAGACLAENGNDLVCGDIASDKIALLDGGRIPIYEPGLETSVERDLHSGRLRFTTDIPEAVRASAVIFIAVGTPPDEDGSADLRHMLEAVHPYRFVSGQPKPAPLPEAQWINAATLSHTTPEIAL